MQVSTHQGTPTTCFSPTCIDVMDFFLHNDEMYFTPTTVALSMKRPLSTIKDCMNLLKRNSYLSKISDEQTVYHITEENMEFWVMDFRNHVLSLAELKQR